MDLTNIYSIPNTCLKPSQALRASIFLEQYKKKGGGAKKLNRPYFSEEDMQMGNGYMKRCSVSLTLREIQTKTTVSYYCTPAKMAVSQQARVKP